MPRRIDSVAVWRVVGVKEPKARPRATGDPKMASMMGAMVAPAWHHELIRVVAAAFQSAA